MKKNLLITALIIAAFFIGFISKPVREYKVQDIYFDGEGNVIPNETVQLLVTSQFVQITPKEKDELKSYFYTIK